MNRIVIDGKQIKVIHYNGELWRADYTYMQKGVNARTNYSGASYKYFTLNRNELSSYTRRGMTHIKCWRPRRALVLVNIMDKSTRNSIADLIGNTNINIAFPLNSTGAPYRVSEEETAIHDDAFLEQLCRLGLDGYYMERQMPRNGVEAFHSEVGLCASTFGDLELISIEKAQNAPAIKNKTVRNRTRVSPLKKGRLFNINNENTNTNNIMSPPKRMRFNNTNKNNIIRKPLFF